MWIPMYYECCSTQDSIDEARFCKLLRWETSDKNDYITNSKRRTPRNVVMGGSGSDACQFRNWKQFFISSREHGHNPESPELSVRSIVFK